MATTNFYLRGVTPTSIKEDEEKLPSKKDKTAYPIYVRFRYGRAFDFNASIGYALTIDNWDSVLQKPKNRTSILNKILIVKRINKIKDEFNKFENTYLKKNIVPTRQDAKEYYDSILAPKRQIVEEPEVSLLDYISNRIELSKTEKNPSTGKPVTNGTIKSYRLTENWLRRYNDTVTPINFSGITEAFYLDFVQWLENNKLSKNYIGKLLKNLKYFMNRAVEDGLTTNTEFRNKKFKVLKEPSESIALTHEELTALWNVDLSAQPRMELARDLFLIGAYTGLRVSDFTNLTERNLITQNGVRMFKITTKKTGKTVAMPLHPIVQQILSKNDGKPPKAIPDQHINNHIKEVGRMAGLKSVEVTKQTIGGKEVSVSKPKFKLIFTHTARRSFCSNAFLSGMPTQFIMTISGHTTEENFLKYVKATPEQVAIEMSKHAFFNQLKDN